MLAHIPTAHCCDDTLWQRFSVEYEYAVAFSDDLFATENVTLLNTICSQEANSQHRVSVFIDEGVMNACPNLVDNISAYFKNYSQHLILVAEPTVMQSGERIKSETRHIERMQSIVAAQRIDRHSYIIGIGGGALLDAVGFVAATSHRGIRHIRIPTTVLAQNDSGVGVKNSINLFGQKNYLGTFAPPFAVLNDYRFIEALPDRDKIAGMAEAVKVALIRDGAFFNWLEAKARVLSVFEKKSMQHMIRRCAELHMQQIANGGDPFESGSARPLDFGHWAAHRLESMTHYQLRHGEAVAIGIALDTRYSVLTGLLEEGADERVCNLLETLGFRLWHRELETLNESGDHSILQGLTDFKEHLGGELTITLLKAPGQGVEVHEMDSSVLGTAIEWLKQRLQASSSCATNAAMHTSATIHDISAIHNTVAVNLTAVKTQLQSWLSQRLDTEKINWLEQRLQLISNTQAERDLHITLGLIPRKLGRLDLNLEEQAIKQAQRAIGRCWNPVDWNIDTAARCLTLVTLALKDPHGFDSRFEALCQNAELGEAIAFYRCTAVLPNSATMDRIIGAGLRTHIRAIFEAIAHRNPYPQLYFDRNRWNHMVLKALFIDSTLHPIQGLEQRANEELARVLCNYAHERWAAHRDVTPELWRCVGPFAKGSMIEDLHTVLSSELEAEQQAGLLSLLSSPHGDHDRLHAQHPHWCAMIESGSLSWDSLR